MSNIIVAFSKRENAVNIRNILTRSGVSVSAVCVTGTKVLQYAELWSDGIVICGTRMQDMHYTQLRELLPENFGMLLVASADKWVDGLPDGVVGLPVPVRGYDLVETVGMLLENQKRRRRRRKETGAGCDRNVSQKKDIDRAKAVLMERNHMSEEEAHRYLQKTSMESGTNMAETAQMILRMMSGG